MEAKANLAGDFRESRNRLADELAAEVESRGSATISTMMARSLVSALAKAIAESRPEALVSWARIARSAYSVAAIREAVSVACDLAAARGEQCDLDFSALLVFLEIAKASVGDAFPGDPAQRNDEQQRVANGVIEGILAMLKAHDEATCAHSHATGAWCRRLAEALNLGPAQTEFIVKAGILHDIGKIGIPDAILLKSGPLDVEEWKVMQRHAALGAAILTELPALAQYAPIVRSHHERWDGNGYPDQLKGEQIAFEARVVAVADAFHAMISNRPYRPAIAQRDAMAILREGRGTQWDATVVDAMLKMLEAPRTRGTRNAARG